MWTQKNRPRYDRDHLRYPSDLTDEEWAVVAPLIPPPRPGGGKRRTDMRAVVNALMYILSTGCQWRYLPKDFPPHSTVYNYFVWWQCDRVLDRVHHALYVECHERAEREASPTAAIIDSQSECTIAWLNRYRRLAKDWENLNRSGLAFLKLASIRLMLRELCNP